MALYPGKNRRVGFVKNLKATSNRLSRANIRRTLCGSPGRFQMSFQTWMVIISWNSRVKSVVFLNDRSTHSSPSTARRVSNPLVYAF